MTHWAALAGVAIALTLLIRLRRHLRERSARRLDVCVGVAGIILWIFAKIWGTWPGNFDPQYSFPLQICDYSALIAPLALVTSLRPLRALLYFWGLGLSSQAIFSPDLGYGPATIKFWLFWLSHGMIVGGAIYDLTARRFRPAWRDFAIALGALSLWFVIVLPIDIVFGFNYGYIGRSRPGQPPIVDAFGAWPGRLVIMSILAIVVFVVLVLPWELARRLRGRSGKTPLAYSTS
jgi:hypothetical integral membrane protein (TIGR02206 family)